MCYHSDSHGSLRVTARTATAAHAPIVAEYLDGPELKAASTIVEPTVNSIGMGIAILSDLIRFWRTRNRRA
jgi:hypothetical protein